MSRSFQELDHRLPWLLVYRTGVAAALFGLVLMADLAAWPLRRTSGILYGAVIATFVVVLVLGLLRRAGVSVVTLCIIHLLSMVVIAAAVVHGSGGVESTLSFMYVLPILDGALIGGLPVALTVAGGCALFFGLQTALQAGAHDIETPSLPVLLNVAVSHIAAFFLTAWLAGHLAEQWRRAREDAFNARSDLRRSDYLHAHVMESLPVGVVTVDGRGIVMSTNAALSRIVGADARLWLGCPAPPWLGAFLARHVATDGAELAVPGGPRYVSLSRSRLEDSGGPTDAQEVVVVDDLTSLRALESSLRLREKMASIGQLSAAIAHELRNPLAAISGCVELFMRDPDERDKLGAIVLREIDRLNTLVNDFLAYARPTPPNRQPVDVANLMREVAKVILQDPKWRGYTVAHSGLDHLTLSADPSLLRQVVWNLLKNALEASPCGAAVDLGAYAVNPLWGVLEVADLGPGFDAAVRSKMFEPFQTTKDQGSGLGLAVVHSIVQAHGGNVEVQPRPQGGTTLRVLLPLTKT